MEIEDPGVVVVLAREDGVVDVGWVYIGECVLMGVPPTEAHIQAAHESDLAVNQAQFLVVSPIQDDVVVHTIQALQGVLGHLREAGRSERQVLERVRDIGY